MNHKPTKPNNSHRPFCLYHSAMPKRLLAATFKARERKSDLRCMDPNDARVKGAAITFRYGPSEWKGVSGEAGEFELELPVQTYPYHFKVQANGFCIFEGELLRVQANRTEMINVDLEVLRTHTECRCSSKRN